MSNNLNLESDEIIAINEKEKIKAFELGTQKARQQAKIKSEYNAKVTATVKEVVEKNENKNKGTSFIELLFVLVLSTMLISSSLSMFENIEKEIRELEEKKIKLEEKRIKKINGINKKP